jgi:hypothetical protein
VFTWIHYCSEVTLYDRVKPDGVSSTLVFFVFTVSVALAYNCADFSTAESMMALRAGWITMILGPLP